MIRRVFKFEINKKNIIDVSLGSKFLSMGIQHDKLVAWFVCPLEESDQRKSFEFHVGLTGHPVPSIVLDSFIFCGTYLLFDGDYVLHVWREKETA